MKDLECVEQTLNALGIAYKKENGVYKLANNFFLTETPNGISITYNNINIDANKYIDTFIKTYNVKLEEKIKRIRMAEASLQEEAILKKYSDEELKREQVKIKREKQALDDLRSKELEGQKNKINETIIKLKEKAKKFGYTVKEEVQGKEKVLIMIKS
jgi:superfamily II RNA helicase